MVRDGNTGKEFTTNVNRLSLFHPWSDSVTSSIPIGNAGDFKVGGLTEVGDLFAFMLENQDIPFGVGRLIGRRRDGTLHFQWVSNSKDSVVGVLRPGWFDNRDRKYIWAKDPPARAKKHYVPLTDEHFDMGEGVRDTVVLVHGFVLDGKSRIPTDTLRFLSASDKISWCVPGV